MTLSVRTLGRAVKKSTVALALALIACATDVGDIDRTQPNKVDKSILHGEWYFRPTVIENSFNQGILFEGLMGTMERVRWDVREHELVAYRSYEVLEGAEDGNGGVAFNGAPVAIFPIDSHFDVFREYNRATGEQSNVLYEDTAENPWWKRKYMRVQWGTNLLVHGYALAGAVQAFAGAPYYVQAHEVDNPDRAEVTANHINVVNNYHLVTDQETCYYAFLDWEFCGSSRAKMKLSFMRVQPGDYEPLHFPDGVDVLHPETGKPFYAAPWGEVCVPGSPSPSPEECDVLRLPMFERFGFFRTERRVYDQEYQWLRSNRVFLANRFNIWQSTRTDKGTLIPPEYRDPGQVIFYTNADFPEDNDTWEATQTLVEDWDQAFRQTVAELRNLGNVPTDPADLQDAAAPHQTGIFLAKQNSCNLANVTGFANSSGLMPTLRVYGINEVSKGNLKRACALLEHFSGGRFTWQKPGDLRHNFIHWVDTPQNAGPLGYGPSSPDPVTGELISSVANVYGAAVEKYAAFAADVVCLMNGCTVEGEPLTLDEVVNGENIRKHILGRGAASFGDFDPAKMAQAMQRMGERADSPNWFERGFTDDGAQGNANASDTAKLERIKGSALERELLMSDSVRRAMLGPLGFQPGAGGVIDDTDEIAEKSPITWMDELGSKHRQAMMSLARQNIMMGEWADAGIVSLAHDLEGKDWAELYAFMRREIYRGVMAHEVGHTLGLRHNFSGSMDPLNYQPEFWDYWRQTTNSEGQITGAEVAREIDGVPTRAERLMYSSIMDYDARFYADTLEGIGPYDRAAIKFGYGQLIEVFEDDVLPSSLDGPIPVGRVFRNPGFEDYIFWNTFLVDYTLYPFVFSADGSPHADNLARRRYILFEDLYHQKASLALVELGGQSAKLSVAVVPYAFCPDEYVYSTNVDCQPYDKGATLLEAVEDRKERYDKYYFFTNFKRDRFDFNDSFYLNTYLSRVHGRYLGPLADVYRSYAWFGWRTRLYQNLFEEITGSFGGTMGDIHFAAAIEGLNFLGSVLTQPEPGAFCLNSDGNGRLLAAPAETYLRWLGSEEDYLAGCNDKLEVPVGVGKYYYTNWTDDYDYKATRIGSFYDKWAALAAMTQNTSSFYRDFGDMLDAGYVSLSYWRGGLQEEMVDLFSPFFLGLESPYAWRAEGSTGELRSVPVRDVYGNDPSDTMPKTVESATSWTLRYYGAVLSMARFNSMYDYTPDFSWFTRVCLEGYQDCVAYDDTAVEVAEFTDPLTGLKYLAARRKADGTETPEEQEVRERMALGYRMLEQANVLATAYTDAADLYSNVTPSPENHRAMKEAERLLNEAVGFIDIVRDLGYLMEYGG